jgi:hypothetical protein
MTRVGSAPVPVPDVVADPSRAARWLCAAPEVLASALAGFSLPTMLLLLAGHLDWPVALPLGVICAIGAAYLCGTPPEPISRDLVRCTAAAAALLTAWTLFNGFFSAQDLFAHRDPATYDLAGRWLVDHPSLHIATQPELFGLPARYTDESAGFADSSHGVIAAQGNHLLPVLLGALGRIFGNAGVLKGNVLFAGLALFALFGLARRVVAPRFALLATGAMAVSLPMIYVSRDTFSETLALLLLMGSLILLHRAITHGRLLDYVMTGFVAGTSAMVRIDAYAGLLAMIVAAAAILAHARPGDRRRAAIAVGGLTVAALVPTAIGWVDVSHLSPAYYADQRHAILQLGEAAVALTVLGAVGVALLWRPGASRWVAAHLPTLATATSGLLVVVFVVLASRPLWMTARGSVNVLYLLQVQKDAHVAQDGYRTYDEQTLSWQALYFGWPTVVLAVAGYVLLIRRLLLTREWALVGVLTMALSMSALYLWTSQITPDQVWASRRYVPVVMPMLLVAAAAALQAARQRWRRRPGRVLTALAALVVIAYPLAVSIPDITVREEVPQLRQVADMCRALPADAAVVALDWNSLWSYQQTVRSYCDVPVIAVLNASRAELVQIRSTLLGQGRVLYVMTTTAATVQNAPGAPIPRALSIARTTRWRSTLNSTPTSPTHETVPILVGSIDAEGYFTTAN